MPNITGAQLRAARALVRWRAEDLAEHSRIGVATIRRAEGMDGPVSMTPANQAAIRAALGAVGVLFVPENGEGPGVRLRKARPASSRDEQIASADDARSQAADAADSMMAEMEGSPGEKVDRRGALTAEPAIVAKAKAKGQK